MKFDFKIFQEKVIGCYLGKCVGGTLGMKYEGNLNYNEVTYYDPVPDTMQPNDDLDLQVVNLESVLRNGLPVNRYHLGEMWKYHMVDQAPDEYSPAISNHALKVYAPLSGYFRNKFTAGMGGAIRSELWACLAPANPTLAMWLAREDACMDHVGDGVFAEMFLAALESQAFVEKDVLTMINRSLDYINVRCRFKNAVKDVIKWWKTIGDVKVIREKVIKAYGSKNWTDVAVNISFIVLSLLASEGSFDKAICTAVSLGYDADCTAATVGAIYGILDPSSIGEKWTKPIGDKLVLSTGVINMHNVDTVTEFCQTIISLSKEFQDFYATEVEIDYPENLKNIKLAKSWSKNPLIVFDWRQGAKESLISVKPIFLTLIYPETVSAMVGKKNVYGLKMTNTLEDDVTVSASFNLPYGWTLESEGLEIKLKPGQSEVLPFTVFVKNQPKRASLNLLTISVQINGLSYEVDAGLPVSNPWLVEDLNTGEKQIFEAESSYFTVPKGGYKYTAKFISQADRRIKLPLGGTRPFTVYLNGEKVFENDTSYYIPAMHRGGRTEVDVKRGENIIDVIFDDGATGEFFLAFGTKEGCGEWIDSMERCEIDL